MQTVGKPTGTEKKKLRHKHGKLEENYLLA